MVQDTQARIWAGEGIYGQPKHIGACQSARIGEACDEITIDMQARCIERTVRLAVPAPGAFQASRVVCSSAWRYACVKPFRNVLYQFAWQSTFQESWAQAYYQRKRREGKSHSMAVRWPTGGCASLARCGSVGVRTERKPSWPHKHVYAGHAI
jgi:hypothetical protein